MHLEFDNFQPDLMIDEGDHFALWRMVPAGTFRYFFSTFPEEPCLFAVDHYT
jgi:hypothetical protein